MRQKLLSGLILGVPPSNERRHYEVTPPLTGWLLESALYYDVDANEIIIAT